MEQPQFWYDTRRQGAWRHHEAMTEPGPEPQDFDDEGVREAPDDPDDAPAEPGGPLNPA